MGVALGVILIIGVAIFSGWYIADDLGLGKYELLFRQGILKELRTF